MTITKLPWRVADWPQMWKDRFEERAGIIQFEDIELTKPATEEEIKKNREAAEKRAEQDIRWQFTQEQEHWKLLW
jgi:hypothetical protein